MSAILQEIADRRWLGDKTGQGFYKKSRGADGKEDRLVLDPATFEYRPTQKPNLPALEMAKNADDLGDRLRMLLAADPAKRSKSQPSSGRSSPRSGTTPPTTSA